MKAANQKQKLPKLIPFVSITLSQAFFSYSAFAAEHGHAAHTPSIADLFYPTINFLVFLGLLYFLLKKPLCQAVEGRRIAITDHVSQAKERLSSSLNDLRSIESKVASLTNETKDLEAKAEQDAIRESESIREGAKKKAARIVDQANLSARSEQKVLEEKLRRELAELVIQKATDRLLNELNEASDRELRKHAVEGLSGLKH